MPQLDTASIFERLFSTYGAIFTLLVPAALLVFLPVALAAALGGVGGLVLAGLLGLVAGTYLQGMAVEAVRDLQDGRRDHDIGSLFGSVTPVLVPLFLAALLAGLITVVGFVLLIVPGLIALTLLAVVAPVVVIERAGAVDALSRSRELVRGNAWRVFGVLVVLFLIQAVVGRLLGALAGDDAIAAVATNLAASVLVAPLSAIAATLVYLDLRRIREGGSLASSPEQPVAGPIG